MRDSIRLAAVIFLLYFLAGCRQEIVPEPYKPRNEHDAYRYSLEKTDLIESALGRDWLSSSKNALDNPIRVETPHKEAFYLDPRKAESIGYRFSVKRGQKIEVTVTNLQVDSIKLFIDLYRINNDSLNYWQHVASADSLNHQLAFEPRKDADYILRFQPELLRGGGFGITIQKVPSFSFPVTGKTSRAIGSYFGDPRDGGKRQHHGVDIFAKRHTPIIAPTRAYVRRVDERGLGGNVIWLRDSKGYNLYFAHLQTQSAKSGTYVNPGDTIGTVGNTGNAKTTPPHLHFGIYRNGPIDPINFIKEINSTLPDISTDLTSLGNRVRTKAQTLLVHPGLERLIIDTLKLHQSMKVIGTVKSSYRVMLPNGIIGYVSSTEVEMTTEPILSQPVTMTYPLLNTPAENSISKEILTIGEILSIIAVHEDYLLVRTSIGNFGWIYTDI